MLDELKKAFKAYSKQPFLFAWGSFLYVMLFLAFFFGCLAVLITYFIALSVFGQQFSLQAIPTIGVLMIAAVLFLFFSDGLNAAVAGAYHNAIWREKTSLTKFYSYALDKAPAMFAIGFIRDVVWAVAVVPGVAVYYYFLNGVEFMDYLTVSYAVFATFIVHMLFTPALVYCGALGASLMSSLKNGITLLRKKHIHFIGMYVLFAIVWLLNFVPFIQLATIFFAYPVVYAAIIAMLEGGVKVGRGED